MSGKQSRTDEDAEQELLNLLTEYAEFRKYEKSLKGRLFLASPWAWAFWGLVLLFVLVLIANALGV